MYRSRWTTDKFGRKKKRRREREREQFEFAIFQRLLKRQINHKAACLPPSSIPLARDPVETIEEITHEIPTCRNSPHLLFLLFLVFAFVTSEHLEEAS